MSVFDTDEYRRRQNAAKIIRDKAARNAAPFSRRIPVGTQVTTHGVPGTVAVETFKEIAPNGYPFEYGVWHPMFGHMHERWFKQPTRPYLGSAIRSEIDDAMDEWANVIDDWCAKKGFTK